MKNHPLHRRTLFGIAGLCDGWRREKAFRSQTIALGLAVILLIFLRPPAWAAALLIAGLVVALAMETMNGAVEALADRLHPDRHEAIRIAKDMSSAAVLILNIANGVLALWIAWRSLS